jgi:hypothetical protein
MSDAATAEVEEEGVLGFLRTDIPVDELRIALKVIRSFKDCESREEWLVIPFAAWAKFEQLEDCLKLLTDTDAGDVDDQRMLDFFRQMSG